MMACQYKHKYILKDKPMKPHTWLAGKKICGHDLTKLKQGTYYVVQFTTTCVHDNVQLFRLSDEAIRN